MKKIILLAIFNLSFLSLLFSEVELDNLIYKEVSVNGNKFYKWVLEGTKKEYKYSENIVCEKIIENGNTVKEVIYEYDKNNNVIYSGNHTTEESWFFYEYDDENRIIKEIEYKIPYGIH